MFQYALSASLNSRKKETEITLMDFTYIYHHNGPDLFEAFDLNIPVKIKRMIWILENVKKVYNHKVAHAVFRRIIPVYKKIFFRQYIEKNEYCFDSNVFNCESKLIIGTWQSEKYFIDISAGLRKEFCFKIPDDSVNKEIIEKIKNSNSVSIHIRRGDYLSKEWISSHSVIKSLAYYENAINYIESHIANPHYFIFSDDMDWVEKNLKLSRCTYINNNKDKNSYVDMYLMSLCQHNIIANSTFSWWGAWLNISENKIVIMPNKWLNDRNCEDIYPENWISIPV